MIFSELYGAYYNIMADILKIAVKRPPTAEEISKIIAAKGFAETNLFFDSSLYEDRYRLLQPQVQHAFPVFDSGAFHSKSKCLPVSGSS